jgi:TPR repeat protein
MSGSILLHRQLSPEELQQYLAWYRIRDTLCGANDVQQDVNKALELAAVCEHPNAVWLTKLFGGRHVNTNEEARQIFRGCENDQRALCFASFLGAVEEIHRAADLGDAFAQAWMARQAAGEERFGWAEKSAAQGERDGFCNLGYCYRNGIACEKDLERAKENFLVAAELGYVYGMVCVGELLDKNDPQRFVWFGRAAANGEPFSFLKEMRDQIRNFSSGTGLSNVMFVIGRALKGHINNESRTLFGSTWNFDAHIGPAKQALQFYEFQLQSCQKAVDSWTIVGLRNGVVRDIRKMIGKMIWDAREEASYLEKKQSIGDYLRAGSNCLVH